MVAIPTPESDPVARLRAAAQKVRDLAEAAAREGMEPYGAGPPLPVSKWAALYGDDYLGGPGGAHVALWSPPVALAVAAWLESEARHLQETVTKGAVFMAAIEFVTGERLNIDLSYSTLSDAGLVADTILGDRPGGDG